MADEDGFLRRWSRRKQEARQGREPAREEERPAAAPEATAPAAAADVGRAEPGREPVPAEERADGRPFSLASLPDIASLGPDSDFRVFMQPGVPPELRTQALRKLWRVKSKVGNPQMLLDYADDYTDAARAVKGLKTLYQVGRGMLSDAELAAGEATRRPPAAPATAAPEPSPLGGEADAGATAEEVASSSDTHDAQAAAEPPGTGSPAGRGEG